MRRFAGLIVVLLLGFGAAASAAVVERPSPSLNAAAAPMPALSLAMFGPAPALLPATPVPGADFPLVSIPAQALAARLPSAPAAQPHERGPPGARDSDFSSVVAQSVADTVHDWKVPSEEILADHDVILVGESHQSLASVTELARALPGLAKAGVKVLGIEGLKRPNQEAVDAYISGRADVLPAEVLSFSPRRRSAFEALLKTARETGVRVVALGIPLDAWARQVAELAAARTGDPFETFLRSPGEQLYRAQVGYEPGYNEAVAEVYLTRRNQSMASFLADALIEGAKAVALAGQNHVAGADAVTLQLVGDPGRWGSVGTELARLGLRAFSLTLTGGRSVDVDGAQDDRAARPASHALAAKASPDGAPAFQRTGADTGLYHAGGMVPASMVAH